MEIWRDVFFMICGLRVLSETLRKPLGNCSSRADVFCLGKSLVAQICMPSSSSSSGKLASRSGDGSDVGSSSSLASSTKAGKGPVRQVFICLVSSLLAFCSTDESLIELAVYSCNWHMFREYMNNIAC